MKKNCSAYPSCPVPGCFALLLAGCSGGGDASEGGDSAGSVTLKIWVQSTNQPEYFQWVKEEFESQNEGIKLKIEPQAQGSLGDSLAVTLGGDDAPDIVATWGGLVASKLYKGNRIIEISDVITDEVEKKLCGSRYLQQDGRRRQVCLPLPLAGFVSPVIYYNKNPV